MNRADRDLIRRKVERAARVAAMMQRQECIDRAFTREAAADIAAEQERLNRNGNILRRILK